MAILGVDGVPSVANQFNLNRMNSYAQKAQLGDKIFSTKQNFVGLYDFSVQGGATGTINLLDSKGVALKLPANFVITNVIIDNITNPTSTASTTDISIGINSTADLLAIIDETAFDGTGLKAGIPVGTAATAVKVTAEAAVTISFATAAVTAGKVYVALEGFQSQSF